VVTAAPGTTIAPEELALQQQAMIPAARGDIARLGDLNQYQISVTIDPQALTLTASERLTYTNRTTGPLNELYFATFPNAPANGAKLRVSRATVDGQERSTSFEVNNTALKVPLAQPLAPGKTASVTLDFVTEVPRDSQGGYAVINYSRGVLALASWYPILRVYEASGWHKDLAPAWGDQVFSETALYTVNITAPKSWVLVASGSVIGQKTNADGTVTQSYRTGPMRDFYIIASEQFQKLSAQVGETTVNSYYLPADKTYGEQTLQFAKDAFSTFSQRFGTYPFVEFDVVESATMAGGIEYPGLVIITDRYYKTTAQPGRLEFVVVHEVAHQWWYSLVGNDQVRHPWVDEALANYSAIVYFETIRGQSYASSLLQQVLRAPYEDAVRNGRDAVVDQPVAAFTTQTYGPIVYDKGALFFDALRQKVGDDVFFKIMQEYFRQYEYKIADGPDFLRIAEQVSGQDLQALYQEWILSKK
jgi:aminopeptidase N